MRENLKKARKDAGLTQEKMAEKLGIGLRHYKYIEAGTVMGTVTMWDTLEDIFNVHQRVLRENHPGKAENPEKHPECPQS